MRRPLGNKWSRLLDGGQPPTRVWRARPSTRALSAVVGFAPALNNVSLKHNGLGFYQVVKLLVTPMIAGAEYACYGHTLSTARAFALALVCVGVGVAVVNDVTINNFCK